MNRNHWPVLAAIICAGIALPGARAEDVKPALPVIPDKTFNLRDYGAVGNGKVFDTDAFTKAVAAVTAAGGGHLIVPAGTYLTKSFSLASHMDLHLERGATIKAPSTYADYGLANPLSALVPATRPAAQAPNPDAADAEAATPSAVPNAPAPPAPAPPAGRGAGGGRGPGGRGPGGRGPGRGGAGFVRALINGTGLTDVSITGKGTIDGSGEMFWVLASGASRRYLPSLPQYPRPVLVSMRGDRMLFDGVTLQNSPMFHLTPSGNDITISNLRIVAPSDAPNTDAMDLRGNRIVVKDCEIDVGDDDVEIGGACHNLLVENITCLHGHGISIGSPTLGGVGQVMVRNCTFDGGENAIRIKSARGRGGLIEDITYQDITIKNITKRPIDIDMLYSGTRPAVPGAINVPELRNVLIKNVTITRSPIAGRIIGLPEKLAKDITLENVKIETDAGLAVQDAENITFKNVQMDVAVGQPVTLDNAKIDRKP